MSTGRRIFTIVLSVITALFALWTAIGWVSVIVNGKSWSDAIALTLFSAVLLVLALVCAVLWTPHSRGPALGFAILSGLAAIGLLASFIP